MGAAATNVAHELVHRLHSPASMAVGRWLLAFSFDTTFSIEHVHGHHRQVCTPADPASARRGEHPLAFAIRSTVQGNISAARIEAERLRRKGLPLWSLHNRIVTGQLMSLALLAAAWALGGFWGAAAFAVAGVQGKMYLELVNYIEHYGLVRAPGGRIEPRHAWNTYRRISSALLYNLPRHSHHHMFAAKPFWTLEAEPGGPTYPHGYMTMILISLVPPLWRAPSIRCWRNGTRRAQATRSGRSSPGRGFFGRRRKDRSGLAGFAAGVRRSIMRAIARLSQAFAVGLIAAAASHPPATRRARPKPGTSKPSGARRSSPISRSMSGCRSGSASCTIPSSATGA